MDKDLKYLTQSYKRVLTRLINVTFPLTRLLRLT